MEQIKDTAKEVIYAIIPIAVVIVLLQLLVVQLPWELFATFLMGLLMVSVGFFCFLLGVHTGLLPVGELIGNALPRSGKLWMVVFFGFLLGFVVTLAEPDVRVLTKMVDDVDPDFLSRTVMIYAIAAGVGLFVALAMWRIIVNVNIIWLLSIGYGIIFIAASIAPAEFISVSFDAGGVTTGPMTVPFILALGIGVASVLRAKTASSDGFGIVALASIGPILALLLLGVLAQ